MTLASDVDVFGEARKPRVGVVSKGTRVHVGEARPDGTCEIVAATAKLGAARPCPLRGCRREMTTASRRRHVTAYRAWADLRRRTLQSTSSSVRAASAA